MGTVGKLLIAMLIIIVALMALASWAIGVLVDQYIRNAETEAQEQYGAEQFRTQLTAVAAEATQAAMP